MQPNKATHECLYNGWCLFDAIVTVTENALSVMVY